MTGSSKKKAASQQGAPLFQKFRRRPSESSRENRDAGQKEVPEAPILNSYHSSPTTCIAQVILNGYNIEQDKSFGTLSAMRSFKIVRGDLWQEWNAQTPVILANANGQEAFIRVAALPVEENSFGLLEFVS